MVPPTHTAPIGWLHLTDLHVGQPGEAGRRRNIEKAFLDDVDKLIREEREPIDVIFFTGDFVFRGAKEEFMAATAALGRICNAVRRANQSIGFDLVPYLVPVPGNHDLVRPNADDSTQLRQAFAAREPWSAPLWQGMGQAQGIVDRCFENYDEWLEHHPLPFPPLKTSGIMTGDISTTLRIRNIKLGVVGLNVAYLHVGDAKPGSLHVDTSQLTAVVGHAPDRWAASHHFCVLLSHHPPTWLQPTAQKLLDEEINPAQRFDLHLFGHEHQGSHRQQPGPLGIKHLGEGRSLFAAEDEGAPRLHGYVHGKFRLRPNKHGGFARQMQWSTRQGWLTGHGLSFDPGASRWGRWQIQVELSTKELRAPKTETKPKTTQTTRATLHPALGGLGDEGRECWRTFIDQRSLWAMLRKTKRKWVFLSASIPSVRGSGPRRANTAELARIRSARPDVIRATIVQLAQRIAADPRFGLLFGGHPSITSLLAPLALISDRSNPWLCVVQDEFYWRDLIDDIGVLVVTPTVLPMLMNNATGKSDLQRMRASMLSKELAAAVFVGGMQGVLDEFHLARELKQVRSFAVAAGGGAAAELLLDPKQWRHAAGKTTRAGTQLPVTGVLWSSAKEAVDAIWAAIGGNK